MTIFIPTPLRPYAEGKDAVEVNAATIADALDALTQTHPALQKHLFTGEGKLRAFVNLYFNDEDVRIIRRVVHCHSPKGTRYAPQQDFRVFRRPTVFVH